MDRDEVKITRKFTKDLISKIIRDKLHKKVGYDVEIQLGDIMITQDDDNAHIDLAVSANISRDELLKILTDIGLL